MHSLRLFWSANNEAALQRRQTRLDRRKLDEIVNIPDLEFVHRFRLDKQTFRSLCDDLRHLTSLKGTREISLQLKVLCTLSFLATGSYQRIVGLSQHLVQRTASRCIRQVVDALSHPAIINKWIVFPRSPQQRAQIRLEFQRRFRLPGVVGCIDCTHVALVKPSEDEHLYFNRKGYHSLNVQMVCDSNLKIINVNSKFGGATHDSFIWASSRMETFMRELHQNGEQVWLLGDSGYPQRPWLMTPILNAVPGSVEDTYTQRHVQARNCIERCFGLLKSRWRCLLRHRTLHYHSTVAGNIVLACCVLHNMALEANLPSPPVMEVEDDAQHNNASDSVGADSNQSELLQGRAALSNLLSRLN